MTQGHRVPLVVHLSVTDRCRCDCARCSNLGTSATDPPLDVIVDLLSRLREAGTVRVAFTGGEPLLRDDLEDLIAACGPDISVQLFTSGHGVSRARARALRDAGLEVAFVSLDDWRSDVHDAVRRLPGCHAQAVSAIRAFSEQAVHTVAQGVASAQLLSGRNLEQYLQICALLGAAEIMLLEPVSVRGPAGGPELRDSERAILTALHTRSARDASIPKTMSTSLLESAEFLGCQAGISFLYVAADGEVYPCDFVPLSFGNAYRDHLEDLLGRLEQCIPVPSCRCMARVLAPCGTGRRLAWQDTLDAFSGYHPGPPPQLMTWYGRNGHGE
jgi:MoaA/NifB/PqqE/SkfB family radical SAM enzyme